MVLCIYGNVTRYKYICYLSKCNLFKIEYNQDKNKAKFWQLSAAVFEANDPFHVAATMPLILQYTCLHKR